MSSKKNKKIRLLLLHYKHIPIISLFQLNIRKSLKLFEIFTSIIKEDIAKRMANAFRPNRRKYTPNPGCSALFPPKDFISATQRT